MSRINSKINNNNNNNKEVEEDSSGGEFSEDEFDPIDADYENEFGSSKQVGFDPHHDENYENIPMVRPAPEGAEADAQYDVPELNESFEKEEEKEEKGEKADLDSSFESSIRLADMSSDSLMVPKLLDTSFDRDSMESLEQEEKEEQEERSVIKRQEGKTIILSPGIALLRWKYLHSFVDFHFLSTLYAQGG